MCVRHKHKPGFSYYDDETKSEGILCGKPECTHEEMTCNAFIQSPMGIQVYDHHLYWLSGATQIWRMNLQGTERELGEECRVCTVWFRA